MYQNSSRPEDNCLYPPDKYIHVSLNDAYSRFANKYILQRNNPIDYYSFNYYPHIHYHF